MARRDVLFQVLLRGVRLQEAGLGSVASRLMPACLVRACIARDLICIEIVL